VVGVNQERLMTILLGPHISEKSTRIADASNQITFKVLRDATKPEIKQAVELLFEAQVKSVTVSNVKGKQKRFGRMQGRRQDWKKAYVTLAPGQEIDFLGTE
jgi:large subunit ribosomal protein L23